MITLLTLEEIQMLWTAAEKRAGIFESEVARLRIKTDAQQKTLTAQQKMMMDLQRALGKADAKAKRPPPIDEGD